MKSSCRIKTKDLLTRRSTSVVGNEMMRNVTFIELDAFGDF
ncbi:MAG: hypothetical protein ACTS68_00670 [Candidatus Hodgkinia cicadicola]